MAAYDKALVALGDRKANVVALDARLTPDLTWTFGSLYQKRKATGQTPSLTFPAAGEGTIDIGALDLRMTARNAAGAPIGLPGGNEDGSFNYGQSLKLQWGVHRPDGSFQALDQVQPIDVIAQKAWRNMRLMGGKVAMVFASGLSVST